MRKPFGKLMLQVRGGDPAETLGDLSQRLGVSAERVMDALEANKILQGKPAYTDENGSVYVDPEPEKDQAYILRRTIK